MGKMALLAHRVGTCMHLAWASGGHLMWLHVTLMLGMLLLHAGGPGKHKLFEAIIGSCFLLQYEIMWAGTLLHARQNLMLLSGPAGQSITGGLGPTGALTSPRCCRRGTRHLQT